MGAHKTKKLEKVREMTAEEEMAMVLGRIHEIKGEQNARPKTKKMKKGAASGGEEMAKQSDLALRLQEMARARDESKEAKEAALREKRKMMVLEKTKLNMSSGSRLIDERAKAEKRAAAMAKSQKFDLLCGILKKETGLDAVRVDTKSELDCLTPLLIKGNTTKGETLTLRLDARNAKVQDAAERLEKSKGKITPELELVLRCLVEESLDSDVVSNELVVAEKMAQVLSNNTEVDTNSVPKLE